MPGVLLEPLFVTRPVEADIASSARGRNVLGAAVAAAAIDFLAAGGTRSETLAVPR